MVCPKNMLMTMFNSSVLPTGTPLWFAAYTCAHRERRVTDHLRAREIECFLPMYKSLRQWKDRNVELELPLFPGYVFVRLPLEEHARVLAVPGVASIVGTSQHPIPVPTHEIQLLMDAKALKVRTEPYRFLTAGTRVRVKSGHFQGVEGFVVRRQGVEGIVVTLKLISSAFLLVVDAADLEPVSASRRIRPHMAMAVATSC